jgi:ribosomal protein S8
LTTNEGIMTNTDAASRGIGGKVLGFFYWAVLYFNIL